MKYPLNEQKKLERMIKQDQVVKADLENRLKALNEAISSKESRLQEVNNFLQTKQD